MKTLKLDGWVIQTETNLECVLSVRLTKKERQALNALATAEAPASSLARRYIMEGVKRANQGQGTEQP